VQRRPASRIRRPGTALIVLLLIAFLPWVKYSWEFEQLLALPEPATAFLPVDAGPAVAGSYRTAKRWMYDHVFVDRRETLYCACPFDAERRPDLAACGYEPARETERAFRIEAEHVVPASWIGRGRACWERAICTGADGDAHGGRRCCEQVDPDYRRAANDLHNLWPTVGEVNARRSNYRFDVIPGEERAFGACDVEIDHADRRIEPRPEVRGDIARIALYMAAEHGVRLSRGQRALFEGWNLADPPDAFERERDARIRALQGQSNPFVADYERAIAGRAATPTN